MIEAIEKIRVQFETDAKRCASEAELEELRVKYLGRRRGLVTEAVKKIGSASPDTRRVYGQAANALKAEIVSEIDRLAERFEPKERVPARLDVSLPAVLPTVGRLHPVNEVRRRIEAVFRELGYRIEDGPQIETDYYNFQALNMPPEHPARDEQDSFYLTGGYLLRTHTSPVQIRVMERQRPPLKIICPGRVYRRDFDMTHTPMFYQIEGLVVDRGVTFGDLKGTLEYFTKRIYGEGTSVRFRPSFFPFTEPSAEVDISCPFCSGSGCRVCKNSGWIEIMGSGMVDPAVFEYVNIDPKEFSGFAFGMGVDRQAMLLLGIDDARLLYENDIRMLNQIGGWR